MSATKVPPENNFADALRTVRRARDVSQEDLGELSSRTYVSSLERGIKSPTLKKIEHLAQMLEVHPLTLLVLAYSKSPAEKDIARTLARVDAELQDIRGGLQASRAS
jgi:transcriptional regulator with XRE-family HTH domain